MTRITYKKQEDGTLTSKFIPSPEGNLVVNIQLNGVFTIHQAEGQLGLKYMDSNPTTLLNAKSAAKKVLESLGASFKYEVRPRNKFKREDLAKDLQQYTEELKEDDIIDKIGEEK